MKIIGTGRLWQQLTETLGICDRGVQLCSNKSFMTEYDISIRCCNLCFVTY